MKSKLVVGVTKDLFAVDIEALPPCRDSLEKGLGLFPFLLAVEHSIDELGSTALAHLHIVRLAALDASPHVLLTCLQEPLQFGPKALAALNEILDNFLILVALDEMREFLCPLEASGKVDQKIPEFGCSLGGNMATSVVELCPVEYPLTQRVGIENGSEKHDGALSRIPVLERVVGRNTFLLGCLLQSGGIKLLRRRNRTSTGGEWARLASRR